jgi:hypothetical protein
MKKLFLFGLAITALVLGSCSKDDINDTKIVVNPNVSDSKLDQKSGGVYFVSTLAGEYIFRLNLKNGDDAMTCEMFHDENYSELAPAETTWEPGEVLDNLQFSSGEVKLILSLNEDGEGEAQVFVEDTEFEAVIFKSTANEPVKVYSGLDIIKYGVTSNQPEIYTYDFVMIMQNDSYFAGKILVEGDDDYRYTPYLLNFIQKDASQITFLNPDLPGSEDDDWRWERSATWDDDKISAHVYEDNEWGDDEYTLTLHRRFKN